MRRYFSTPVAVGNDNLEENENFEEDPADESESNKEVSYISPAVSMFLLFPNLKEEIRYLNFQRATFVFSPIHLLMTASLVAILTFPYTIYTQPKSGDIFITASVINSFTGFTLFIFLGSIITKRLCIRSKIFTKIISFLPIPIEDLIVCGINVSAAINAIYIGISTKNSSRDENIVGDDVQRAIIYISIDQIVTTFLSIFIVPIITGASTKWAILASWLISLGFLCFIETFIVEHSFPYLSLCSELFLLAAVYQIERNKMIIYESYKRANHSAAVSQVQEGQERKKRRKEQFDRKLNDALVHQMLPKKVAEKLRAGKKVLPEEFSEVTIFFSDVEGFTNICAQVKPIQVVNMLNELYTVMDYCTSLFPLYKVETIGDAYMVRGRV